MLSRQTQPMKRHQSNTVLESGGVHGVATEKLETDALKAATAIDVGPPDHPRLRWAASPDSFKTRHFAAG